MPNAHTNQPPRAYPFVVEVRARRRNGVRPRAVVLEKFGRRFRIRTLAETVIPGKPRPLTLERGQSYLALSCELDFTTATAFGGDL